MTTIPLPDIDAVLIRAETPPSPPTERFVDVRPGTGSVFDGCRWRRMLAVGVADSRDRTYASREHRDAIAGVVDRLSGQDVDVVRFGNRSRLRENWPAPVVRGAERRLATAARRLDGLLVTWTDGRTRPDDGELYDAVLD